MNFFSKKGTLADKNVSNKTSFTLTRFSSNQNATNAQNTALHDDIFNLPLKWTESSDEPLGPEPRTFSRMVAYAILTYVSLHSLACHFSPYCIWSFFLFLAMAVHSSIGFVKSARNLNEYQEVLKAFRISYLIVKVFSVPVLVLQIWSGQNKYPCVTIPNPLICIIPLLLFLSIENVALEFYLNAAYLGSLILLVLISILGRNGWGIVAAITYVVVLKKQQQSRVKTSPRDDSFIYTLMCFCFFAHKAIYNA